MRRGLVALLLGVLLAGCTGAPPQDLPDDLPDGVTVVEGDDWSLPSWVRPATNSGFFSEEADPEVHVDVHSVDVTWAQVRPDRAGAIDSTATGSAQDMDLASLDDQLSTDGDVWVRLFASGQDWAPAWVVQDCGVSTYGPDDDGERHLPIWDECVWGHLLDTYRELFAAGGMNLAADPRVRFVYVPGAFTWAEFDYDIIADAVEAGDLDLDAYLSWYDHAWTDLVDVFGENASKLVFTGEDYPFGPFGAADDLLAARAVDAGLGIRTGIGEVSNFHLSQAPAYGSTVQPDGHLVVDETLPVHDGTRVVAGENECFTDCGYDTDDPYYAVRQANLKALQLRMNWMYVVPEDSYLREYPGQWEWMRLSLGQRADTSPDAWAALREAEDTYWSDEGDGGQDLGPFADPAAWPDRPWVRNLERWLVQVDEPGSVAHPTDVDVHTGVLGEENGTAREGLSTAVADGDTGFAFDVDPRFAQAAAGSSLELKVTYLDTGDGSFSVDTGAGTSAAVPRGDTGDWLTATVTLPDGALEASTRVRVSVTGDDIVVRFVRLVRG